MSAKHRFIGFPPPLLGPFPLRVEIVYQDSQSMAFTKPAGIPLEAHPWFDDSRVLISAINQQCAEAKPELERLGMKRAFDVHAIDPEIEGLCWITKCADAKPHCRNLVGSYRVQFNFGLVSDVVASVGDEKQCDLPVALHKGQRRCLISHKTGKRSETLFRCIAAKPNASLWQAQTTFVRLHQIPLHAFESGIPVINDPYYRDGSDAGFNIDARPLYWLQSIQLPDHAFTFRPSRTLRNQLRRLDLLDALNAQLQQPAQ